MVAFALLQMQFSPYANYTLNRVELMSIINMTISLLIGMLLVTGLGEEVEILASCALIIINGSFLTVWGYVYVKMSIRGTRFERMLSKVVPLNFVARLTNSLGTKRNVNTQTGEKTNDSFTVLAMNSRDESVVDTMFEDSDIGVGDDILPVLAR